MTEQQLEFVPVQPTAEDVSKLLSVLMTLGWMTRKQLASHLSWSERSIRAVAEAAGDDIVRGPKGFREFRPCDTGRNPARRIHRREPGQQDGRLRP
jgi:hypothetical protein